jgi:hypothetical protein
MTLGNTAAVRVRLIVWCGECQHQVEPDPAEMVATAIKGSPVSFYPLAREEQILLEAEVRRAGDGAQRRLGEEHRPVGIAHLQNRAAGRRSRERDGDDARARFVGGAVVLGVPADPARSALARSLRTSDL